MGVDHLQGKRTGRPRGSSSTPAWVRDLHWAERHLGDPDAVPPSPLAGRLLALARDQPDRFLACLALRDAQGQPSAPPRASAVRRARGARAGRAWPYASRRPVTAVQDSGGPAGAPGPAAHRRRRLPWVRNLSAGFQVTACVVGLDRETGGRWRRVPRITLESAAFPEVLPGAPVPQMVPDFAARRAQ
jgi:hypothetical protein